jgi:hypothetical protein
LIPHFVPISPQCRMKPSVAGVRSDKSFLRFLSIQNIPYESGGAKR